MDCKPVDIPMVVNHRLQILKTSRQGAVSEIRGKLIYLSHNRPDIAYAVCVISIFMHNPSGRSYKNYVSHHNTFERKCWKTGFIQKG